MGNYLVIREHVHQMLANIHASLELNDAWTLRRDADEALALVRRILRRWPLTAAERGELIDLAATIERVRSALPTAVAS